VAEKAECEHRSRIKAAVAKMSVRSVRHTCKARVPLYRPGDAVFVKTANDMNAPEDDFCIAWFSGVFVAQKGRLALAHVADGTECEDGVRTFVANGSGVVKVPLSRVKPRPGAPASDVSQCRWCAAMTAIGQKCGRDPHYTPPGDCQAAQRAKAA